MPILLKRAYAPAAPGDGYRILVDRLWPRGVAKLAAHIDLWPRDVTPSTALRQWFGHDPAKWAEFGARYVAELEQHPEAVTQVLAAIAAHAPDGVATLVYAAKDEAHSHARVLKDYLDSRLAAARQRARH